MNYALTPTAELQPGETVIESFSADRDTYIRAHAWLAAFAMALAMGVLWLIGNPYPWTGAIGGLAAIILRGWFVASDELGARWDLTDRRLLGPGERAIPLGQIDAVRTIANSAQVITRDGGKHLIKFRPDPEATAAAIRSRIG